MNASLDNISPEKAAIIAAFSLRLNELVKRKKANTSNVKLRIEDEEIIVPREVLSYLKEVSSKKNKQRKDEVSFEEAMVTLDVSSEEMQGLMSKKAITYRKSGDSIFVSRKEVEKYAEILLEKRLKGMEKIIQLQQEMGLYK